MVLREKSRDCDPDKPDRIPRPWVEAFTSYIQNPPLEVYETDGNVSVHEFKRCLTRDLPETAWIFDFAIGRRPLSELPTLEQLTFPRPWVAYPPRVEDSSAKESESTARKYIKRNSNLPKLAHRKFQAGTASQDSNPASQPLPDKNLLPFQNSRERVDALLKARLHHTTMAIAGNLVPAPPAEWKGDSDSNPNFKAISTLSPPVLRQIEPYGAAFLAHARRKRHGRTFSEDDRIQALSKVKKIENDDDGEISEPEDPMMLARDAKDWKGQDHYAVLGLSKYRFRATEAQIKAANRRKVLKHHPDKKAAAGQDDSNDSFFKCIQRATEVLLDPVRRRQFDSVDEAADVEPPTKKDITKPSHFYKKWGPVFVSEGRFSKNTPVPVLGDENSSQEHVEEFYEFWYNFDSWRTFEYLDEDVPDDNAGRDHKRHIEKKNANARRKRKTEDTARLRKLVDDCVSMDERIKKFRKAASANKNKKRLEKEAAAKKEAEEKTKAKEEEERKRKEAEEAAKAEKEQGKKAKEVAKTAVKKNKRVVRGSVKDVNYFAASGDASAQQIDDVLNEVDKILTTIDPDELADLVSKLNVAGKDSAKVKSAFTEETSRLVGAGKLKEAEIKIFQ